ncbi:MAG: hypothetical protein RSE29_18900 [Leclercia sp.]
MLHLRRRVRNARNNHRTGDDVGWIIPDDAERTRSPGEDHARVITGKNDASHAPTRNSRQSYLIGGMAHRDLT